METIIKREKDGLKIEVKINQGVKDNIAYADGDNINLGKKTYKFTTIKIKKNGKSVFCRDLNFFKVVDSKFNGDLLKKNPKIYARIGDTYISKSVYNSIKEVLDEAEASIRETNEFKITKADENAKKAEGEKNAADIAELEANRRKHPGWCDKCHSYCYGDCEA